MKKTKQTLAAIMMSLIIFTFFAVLTSTSALGQNCAPGCPSIWIGDTICDPDCLVAECSFDDGDCDGISFCAPGCFDSWVGDNDCDPDCNVAACSFDNGDCDGISFCAPGCFDSWVGDTICDPECSVLACNFDDGDCDNTFFCAPGCPDNWVGDAICDPDCNVAACNYDDGDCDPEPDCAPGCPDNLIGNNICNPECSVLACNFDDGDCGSEGPEGSSIDLKKYNLSIWDFSGSYDAQPVPNGTAKFTLIQDAKGKITGSGNKSYYIAEYGVDVENIAFDIKGKVNGKKGTVTVKIKTKGDSNASYDGKSYNIKSKDKMTLGLNGEKDALVGSSKGKVCAKGAGCESGSNNIEIGLLDNMTGEAKIAIDSDNQTGKFSGNGELILSNKEKHSLSFKAKNNSKKGETNYQLKGEKGIKFKLKMNASDNATQINGKAFGQQLKYKQ